MAQNYKVEYYASSTWTALTGVQNIDLRWGRQKITDVYSPNTGTIRVKSPNYFASPITALVPGTQIKITNQTTSQEITTMYLSNVEVEYGIPYVASQGQADYITLSVEGGFAKIGRAQGNNYAMAAGLMSTQLSTASTQTGVTIGVDSSNSTDMLVGASTVSGSWGDWLNTFLTTTGSRLQDYNSNPNVSYKYAIGTGLNFSDTTNDATNKKYNVLNFGSLVDNYYTQVEIDPTGLAASIVQTGSAPYRTLRLSTFNPDSSQATDLANYYLAALSATNVQPISISMLAEAQAVNNLDYNFFGRTNNRSTLTFRGTTQTVMVIGGSMSATPESMVMTCYLSGFNNQNFFTLNSSVFGTLDYNRLGF